MKRMFKIQIENEALKPSDWFEASFDVDSVKECTLNGNEIKLTFNESLTNYLSFKDAETAKFVKDEIIDFMNSKDEEKTLHTSGNFHSYQKEAKEK
ncbi:TPA: hypothetical protein O4I50_001248 [Vibrio parahaemolyticus]|nr:hypothetical protein [Vibrio parahaemolyticus]